jgi:hypothetical protein
MEASQVFATGGVSSIIVGVLILAYKYFTTPHRIRSKCCGKTIDLETEASDTPQDVPKIKPFDKVETDESQPSTGTS